MDFWTTTGVILTGLIALRFISQLGKSLPILELMLFIAAAQWIIGPLIEYNAPSLHYKYYMYVDQQRYMSYVVPAFGAFALAVLLGIGSLKDSTIPLDKLKHFKDYGVTIFVIGVFFDLIGSSLPPSLAFFAFIISNFKFAGAIILFFSNDQRLKPIFYASLVFLLFRAIQSTMFHDFILWTAFFYMFWALQFKPSRQKIVATLLIGALSLTTLQTMKYAYRQQVWNGYSSSKIELFTGLVVDAILLDGADQEQLDGELNNVRLNQGWIISAILDEVPEKQPFFEGETIKEAIGAAVLPRFLNPNKKTAGGQENFRKFTGLELGEGTSMGISIVGEAYGNFNRFGGVIFMGIWGYFLAMYWRFLFKGLQNNVLLLAFLPIVFLQVIKAETELVVVLNHLIKASIVVYLFFWAAKAFLNWNLKDD
jgi:hypothetical protein